MSSSTGKNANSGLTPGSPVRTLAKGFRLLRNGRPDWLLLKRGDTWHETVPNIRKSSGDPDSPMVIRAYGNGPRPKILTPPDSHGAQISGEHGRVGLAFVSLHMAPDGRATNQAPYGFRWLGDGDHILFEDMLIEGYSTNISLSPYQTEGTSNVTIRRSVIVDAWPATTGKNAPHSQGLYAHKVQGLTLEGNLFDHNGWNANIAGADPTKFNHNVYIPTSTTDVVLRGNIFARAATTGAQARGGGIVESNLFVGNPVGLNFGLLFGGSHPPSGVSGTVASNVFIDHPDRNVGNWGIGVANIGAQSAITNNLLVRTRGDALHFSGPNGAQNGAQPVQKLDVSDNVIVDAYYPVKLIGEVGVDLKDLTFRDNVLQNVNVDAGLVNFRDSGAGFHWSGNTYYSVAGTWFTDNDGSYDLAQWQSKMESNAKSEKVQFPNSSRSVASYNKTLGGARSFEAFLGEVRTQSKKKWRHAYTASAVNSYIMKGFNMSPPPSARSGVAPIAAKDRVQGRPLLAGEEQWFRLESTRNQRVSLQTDDFRGTTSLALFVGKYPDNATHKGMIAKDDASGGVSRIHKAIERKSYLVQVTGRTNAEPYFLRLMSDADIANFSDIASHFAKRAIRAMSAAGITGGCGGNLYCPAAPVTRAQMAVFLVKAIKGGNYAAPAPTGNVFDDVSARSFAAGYIEEAAALGITSGCGKGNYCPDAPVTREQMAVFLLRAWFGAAYTPPHPTQAELDRFKDIADSFAKNWIVDLVREDITGGCGPNRYCPVEPVTRGQMAAFIQRTFDLDVSLQNRHIQTTALE